MITDVTKISAGYASIAHAGVNLQEFNNPAAKKIAGDFKHQPTVNGVGNTINAGVDLAAGAAAGILVGTLGEVGLQKQAASLYTYFTTNNGVADKQAYVEGVNLTGKTNSGL